jgi:hypothetical protein
MECSVNAQALRREAVAKRLIVRGCENRLSRLEQQAQQMPEVDTLQFDIMYGEVKSVYNVTKKIEMMVGSSSSSQSSCRKS